MAKGVRWDLSADPTRFNRGFREAERTTNRFQRHMQQVERSNTRFSASFGKLGPVAIRAFGGATVAAGGLAAAGAVLGIKTAANLETARIGFTRLLGSGKEARRFLGELKTFAARTPFELPGLVDASRALVGAGTAAKDVIPILTALGDASGALGLDQDRFGRVMIAVTQIMNRGKVQAEELMQITEAGIPVWQLLAKATGKPVPELQKLMQAGKLLAKDTLPLLFDQMRKDYGGGMAQQAKSLTGLWSTFKDTIALTLSDALQPLVPVLKTALPIAGQAFERSIKGITDFVRSDLAPELGRVKQAWEDNKNSIIGFVTSLTGTQSGMAANADAARSLADALETLIRAGGRAAEIFAEVNDWLNKQNVELEDSGHKINEGLVEPMARATLRFGEFFGLRPLPQLQGLADRMSGVTEETDKVATATDRAATAAERHKRLLQDQKTAAENAKTALEDLRHATDDEAYSEVNLRQAKLNVSTAQKRLTELRREGKTGTDQYKQAQIDLTRAKIDLREKTRLYRDSLEALRSKTESAKLAQQAEARAAHAAGDDTREAGHRASVAAINWGKLRDGVTGALDAMRSKKAFYTASFSIHTPPGVSVHQIVGATGGEVTPYRIGRHGGGPMRGPGTGTSDSIPAWLSNGEHVWTAREVVAAGGHAAMERWRKAALHGEALELARGGPVPSFRTAGEGTYLGALRGFPKLLDRGLGNLRSDFAAWARTYAAFPPHAPGGWQVALQFLRTLGIPYNVISTFRPGARTHASGAVSYHALNRAVDLTGDMLAIWSALSRTNPTELIYSRAPTYKSRSGWHPIGALDPITRADHYSHVHAAYRRGGRIPEDVFGMGRSGRTYSFHGGETVTPKGGIDYDRLADALVRALERYGLRVGVDDVHTALLAKKRRQGRVALGLD